jgi:hypothetical protein
VTGHGRRRLAALGFRATGDQTHLRPLDVFEGIRIVTPREFLARDAGGAHVQNFARVSWARDHDARAERAFP